MPSEHIEEAPGNKEAEQNEVKEVVQENTVEEYSWNDWASENKQVLWGVAAGSVAVLLGFAIRSFSRRA